MALDIDIQKRKAWQRSELIIGNVEELLSHCQLSVCYQLSAFLNSPVPILGSQMLQPYIDLSGLISV